jgi:subtilase family serine protease
MHLFRSPARWGAALTLAVSLTVPLAFASTAGAAASGHHLRSLKASRARTGSDAVGSFSASRMSVDLVLSPRHPASLKHTLHAVYTRHSGRYHQWLRRGQFASRFGPSAHQRRAVARYLRAQGLSVHRTKSPFILRATGSSRHIEGAFHTSLRTYTSTAHPSTKYVANSKSVKLPAPLSRHVLSVVGLTNTVRLHSGAKPSPMRPAGHAPHGQQGCEAPYPTRQDFFDAVNNGTSFPFGYGGGPGCNGLTPSQVRSIYHAPHSARALGKGATVGLFELSAYQRSDIATWAHTFYGHHFHAPLRDRNVDGGPLNVHCPTGDTCPPEFEAYAGDIEVVADIEATLAVAPHVHRLIVYNAPNDFTGQTELDEYSAIAQDDRASSISSSWGLCEADAGAAYAQAENLIFEQIALQGQSLFGDSGDTGAFDCIRDGTGTAVNVADPGSQPWMTSVGGTSFENFNPGHRRHPSYPGAGEAVWNVDNLCAPPSVVEGGQTGDFWCTTTGADGGGHSQFWGRPFYQRGPGVNNPNTVRGNGTTQCAFASTGTPCREVPDVSANADEYTPYAEFCTGSSATPNSVCGTFSDSQTPPGWFGIGGTSLSSPVWSAIMGDRNGLHGRRTGNANVFLYSQYVHSGHRDFHDILQAGHVAKNNGLYPVRRDYDLATGIGSPKMSALIRN